MRASVFTMLFGIVILGLSEPVSAWPESPVQKPSGAILVSPDSTKPQERAASVSGFGETTLGTNFVLPPGGFRNFTIPNVGGADRIRFSVLTNPATVPQLRLRVFFATPGATIATVSEGGELRGALSPYTDVLTGSVPVHGSSCTVQVVNDGPAASVVAQLTAYWVVF